MIDVVHYYYSDSQIFLENIVIWIPKCLFIFHILISLFLMNTVVSTNNKGADNGRLYRTQ